MPQHLSQVKTNQDFHNVPTEGEIRKAIKQLFYGKAPGANAIPAEIYKPGGPVLLQ